MGAFIRSSFCWSCSNPLESNLTDECPVCGWMICPVCGACMKYGCISLVADSKLERIAYRDLYVSQTSGVERWERPDIRSWFRATTRKELKDAENAAIIKIQNQEAEKQRAIEEENRRRRQQEQEEKEKEEQRRTDLLERAESFGVCSTRYGRGELVRQYYDNKFPMIECSFGGEKKSFRFPEAFDSGFLSINK